jgi:MFS family permease
MEKPSNYKWWVVGMLWCICVLNYADRQAIFSVFPKLKEEFGFDKVQLGLIGSAFMWVYAGGALFAGLAGDIFRRKHLILGGCLFWSGVTMLTGFCGKLWQFVTVRAAEGFGETFYFPASMSMLSDYHSGKTRSRAMSLHQSSVYIGTIAGSWWGAWFAEQHGWRVGFYVFGGAGLVLAIVLFRFLREPPRIETDETSAKAEKVSISEGWAAIFSTPAAVLIMGAFVGANFVATIFLTWTPTFLVEKFGFKLTAAGLSGSVFIHLASACSVPIAGLLADRLAARRAGGRMLVQIGGLVVGSAFVFIVGGTKNISMLIFAMIVFGACKGFYDSNIFAAIYDVVPTNVRASAAGIMNTVGWGGGALGPLAVGWFSKHGGGATEMENMSLAISSCSVIYLVSAGLLFFAVRLIRSTAVSLPAKKRFSVSTGRSPLQ